MQSWLVREASTPRPKSHAGWFLDTYLDARWEGEIDPSLRVEGGTGQDRTRGTTNLWV